MKPSRRMRVLFALIGAGACLVAALLAEVLFGAMNTAGHLERRNTPALLFVDAFGRRLQREGGQTGDVRITLVWNNRNDLDLWCVDPAGQRIFFRNPRSRSGGRLDVDMNANPARLSDEPVENIFWPVGGSPRGSYRVLVNHYANHGSTDPTPYQVEVLNHGVRQTFQGQISRGQPARAITTFEATQGVRAASALPPGFWTALLATALWAALLAVALFGAIAWALYQVFGRPPLSRQWWARRAGLALAVGALAGAAGQGLYSLMLAFLPFLPGAVVRLAGWVVLAVVMGYGLGGFTPCLPRGLASRCALFGGMLALAGFTVTLLSGDGPARIVAGMLLGATIGWAVSVVLPEARPEPEPKRRVLVPVTLRAHELRPAGSLGGRGGGRFAAMRFSRSPSFTDSRGARSSGRNSASSPFVED